MSRIGPITEVFAQCEWKDSASVKRQVIVRRIDKQQNWVFSKIMRPQENRSENHYIQNIESNGTAIDEDDGVDCCLVEGC